MTQAEGILQEHRKTWENKRVVRLIYEDYYRRISGQLVAGDTLEIGSGIGQYTRPDSQLLRTDIQFSTWLDFVADAQSLPLVSESFDNIVLVDVLHHIEDPLRFIDEACRVLRTGGRLVMLEPAITPLSGFFYRFLHREPVDLHENYFSENRTSSNSRDPYDANQAIPTILFRDSLEQFMSRYPLMHLKGLEYLSMVAYPLSGGFNRWSLIPPVLVPVLLGLEQRIPRSVRKAAAFRMLVTLERA